MSSLKDKIKKLWAMSKENSGCTDAEMSAALGLAKSLAESNGLNLEQLVSEGLTTEEVVVGECTSVRVAEPQGRKMYQDLQQAIIVLFGEQVVSYTSWWDTDPPEREYRFVGFPSTREAASQLFLDLYTQCLIKVSVQIGSTTSKAAMEFTAGFCKGVLDKAKEITPNRCTGLVITTEKVMDYMFAKYCNSFITSGTVYKGSGSGAYTSGFAQGREANLSTSNKLGRTQRCLE